MPLDEYNQVISSCGLIIMAHKRQQAIGNICSAMYSGARIVLDEESPLYQFFVERGAVVNSLCGLNNPLMLKPLSECEVSRNRTVIQRFWGADEVKKNTKSLIGKIQAKQQSQAMK
ncbi:hypothetical protein D9M68_826000 [compost metagenome]